jgi:tetratricopeptide (TPR) repeat protein
VLSLLTLCASPLLAQESAAPDMGKIHGRVISPTGQPQNGGTVSLSTDGGDTMLYNFPVSTSGEYAGEASLGEYTLIYRAADTPEGKVTDFVQGVVVLAGKDVAVDVDMTRKEYMDRLSPEQQKQIEQMKEAAAAAAAASNEVANANADLQTVNRDLADAANARATATQALGKDATVQEIDAKSAEIEKAKYTEVETLMTKDTTAVPGESVLWIGLARAEVGLKNYLDAETNFKKALDLESKAQNPQPQILGAANSGLGEVYARTLRVDEASAAYGAAAKADPSNAAIYYRNAAVIFYQQRNVSAQVDAADKAIKADPTDSFVYYIKGAGLAQNAPFDPATDKSVLPPDCVAAFHKYLELAPNGPFAGAVTTALERSEDKMSSPVSAPAK